ncbi:uncharacterized protein LOC121255185 [Juglans microcarpa x Juglans regia]|uniref:uncharacterized protein LOC121255185 n=1 Tax=Juglans microcarpa x Juglans regia TaxID=2249226 RepID=UPI001B7DBD5D|nr:uncharacterized protein LOC121255185 [Juglans microcarpa x Juglans regia]
MDVRNRCTTLVEHSRGVEERHLWMDMMASALVIEVFVNGSSFRARGGVGVHITTDLGKEHNYAIKLAFKTTNNEAEYEALPAELLVAEKLGATEIEVKVKSQEGYESLIKRAWKGSLQSGSKADVTRRGLERCRYQLREWYNISRISHQRALNIKTDLLRSLQASNTGLDNDHIRVLQKEFDASLEEVDLKWCQRAKQKWLKDGNRNTKFFHKCASVKKQKNLIQKLQTKVGQILTNPDDIGGEFQSVFRDLFTSFNPIVPNSLLENLRPTVMLEMNFSLTKVYSREEIELAIFQMNPLGSPGPDGFPVIFFQKHWHIVGDDVVAAVLELLNTKSGFQVAYELMHSMQNRRTNHKEGFMALKLDISKSYDRLEWSFVQLVLQQMGFDKEWIELITQCIRTVSYSILLNGSPQSAFKGNQNSKMHWLNWKGLGKGKQVGGLGFRDFEDFNKALLAKQEWRLITNTQSLASRVLKAKYFPSTEFSSARVRKGDSFVWKSITAARPLLYEGLLWKIGNGNQVKIWSDRWLPIPMSYKTQCLPKVLNTKASISSLIDQDTHSWNLPLVQSVFILEEAVIISIIHISPCKSDDKLVWRCTKNGIFSVKSAYHLLVFVNDLNKGQASDSTNHEVLWKLLWKLRVPNKVKMFLWRSAWDILPTRVNLHKMKIIDSPMCPICLTHPENVSHVLWTCKAAQDVWSNSSRRLQKSRIEEAPFYELLTELLSTLPLEEHTKLAFTAKDLCQEQGKLQGWNWGVNQRLVWPCDSNSQEPLYSFPDTLLGETLAALQVVQFGIEIGLNNVIFEGIQNKWTLKYKENNCNNRKEKAPSSCGGACSTRAALGENRRPIMEVPNSQNPATPRMEMAEGLPTARESHSLNASDSTDRTYEQLAAPFGAAFGSLEDRRLGNAMERHMLIYGRRKHQIHDSPLFSLQNTKTKMEYYPEGTGLEDKEGGGRSRSSHLLEPDLKQAL